MYRLAIVLVLLGVASAAGADSRADYLLHCGGCHLPTGYGDPPNVPSLHGDMGRMVATPEGREYLYRVPGAAQAQVDDERLAGIINWILQEFNADTLPEDFTPVTAAEVSEGRPNILADPLKFREQFFPDL